jgi:hypothetical protein
MRRPHLRPDPLGIPRNPFQVYLLCLAILSGGLLAFGVTTSGSIEDSLPTFYATSWGLMLVFGSAAALAGMFWPGDPMTGLVVKRSGLVAVGIAATVYVVVLVLFFGMRASLAAGVTLGFAYACFWQVHQINRHIRAVIAGLS